MRAFKIKKVLQAKPLKATASEKRRGVDGSPSAPSPSMPLLGGESDCPGPQFGISISRKVSKRAVIRNRIKRQLRAAIQQYLSSVDPCWQVVIVVRPPAVECSFDDFLRELDYLLKKLDVVT